MTEARRSFVFGHLFAVYLLAAASETFISPLFPFIRRDFGISVSDQASLTAVLTMCIGVGNVAGGWIGSRFGDRHAVRLSAALLAVGSALSGMSPGLPMLYAGQAVCGFAGGLFFAPGLALVGRMYSHARGRAIASYGLAYSMGLALAAFSPTIGDELWRVPFLLTAVLAAGFALVVPRAAEAEAEGPVAFFGDALVYFRDSSYRASLVTAVAAGATHYVVIGLTPEHFVERGTALALVAGLVGVGRLASVPGKIASGWLFDHIGGPRTAQLLLVGMVITGTAELVLPRQWGLWAVAPFVCITAMLFPVSNAMVVAALPGRASWGVGIYRSCLMLFSAVLAGLTSLALHVVGTTEVMLVALVVPLSAAVGMGRRAAHPVGIEASGATRVPTQTEA